MPAAAQRSAAPLVIAEQGSFFVGGRDVYSEMLSTVPTNPPTGTITVEQVYVRYQVPVSAARPPITLIHGCCLTGKTWETTPDGRMGWDEYFVRAGHAVYVVDQVSRGRSAANPGHQPRETRQDAARASCPRSTRRPRSRVDDFPFRPRVSEGLPRHAVSARGDRRIWKQWCRLDALVPTPNPTVPALSELAKRLDEHGAREPFAVGIYPFQTAALEHEGHGGIVSMSPARAPIRRAGT